MADDTAEYLRKNPSHLALRLQNLDNAPDYLRSTVIMLHSAFPSGLPLADYLPLLCLLRSVGWSFRGLAVTMETCFVIDYHDALHDAYGSEPDEPPVEAIELLRQQLLPHGFEAWLREQLDT